MGSRLPDPRRRLNGLRGADCQGVTCLEPLLQQPQAGPAASRFRPHRCGRIGLERQGPAVGLWSGRRDGPRLERGKARSASGSGEPTRASTSGCSKVCSTTSARCGVPPGRTYSSETGRPTGPLVTRRIAPRVIAPVDRRATRSRCRGARPPSTREGRGSPRAHRPRLPPAAGSGPGGRRRSAGFDAQGGPARGLRPRVSRPLRRTRCCWPPGRGDGRGRVDGGSTPRSGGWACSRTFGRATAAGGSRGGRGCQCWGGPGTVRAPNRGWRCGNQSARGAGSETAAGLPGSGMAAAAALADLRPGPGCGSQLGRGPVHRGRLPGRPAGPERWRSCPVRRRRRSERHPVDSATSSPGRMPAAAAGPPAATVSTSTDPVRRIQRPRTRPAVATKRRSQTSLRGRWPGADRRQFVHDRGRTGRAPQGAGAGWSV